MKHLKIHKEKNGANLMDVDPIFGNELFPEHFKGFFPSFGKRAFFKEPVVDIFEDDKEITIKAEVPGISEKDLVLSYMDGVLYLKGEKHEEKESKEKRRWHRESWHGSFSRGLPIGRHVDWQKVHAEFKNGVLSVTLPKNPDGNQNRLKINIQ